MPGMFVSQGGQWVPDEVSSFENGKIATRHLKNEKIMGATIRVKDGYMTVREALGAPVSFVTPDGKTIAAVGPCPAALDQIKRTMQDSNAKAMPSLQYPKDSPTQTIQVSGGADVKALQDQIAALTAVVEGLKGVPAVAGKK